MSDDTDVAVDAEPESAQPEEIDPLIGDVAVAAGEIVFSVSLDFRD